MRLSFIVDGHPVPQGSMTASYNKKLGVSHVHHVQGEALAMWRAMVRRTAIEAGATKSFKPIAIQITFGMRRPKAHLVLRHGKYIPKMQYLYALPAVAPDIDKLSRAIMDALTDVCYNDDAQVVMLSAVKVYASHTHITISDELPSPQETFGLGEVETLHPN